MLWNKENKFWSKYDQSWTTEEFLKTLDKVYTYAKCTSAAAYTTTHKLNDLFDVIHYQHGFYFWVLGDTEIYINDHKFEPGKLYNLSIIFTKEQLLAGSKPPVQKSDYIDYSIRYAISNGLAVAANSNLFRIDGAYNEFKQLLLGGTSGTAGLPFYASYNLTADYTEQNVYGVFNTDFDQLGYSIPNYFTADTAINKLLSNFKLVDVVSDVNIDTTQLYQSLEVDSLQLFENQVLLLLNQDNPVENGPYQYANQILSKVDWVDTTEDLNLLTLFVKEGAVYKSKEFFLSRKPDGTFPDLSEPKYFETGDNLLLRNKVSYKLLQDNETRDGFYFTEKDPIISANFTDSILVNGVYYQISDNGNTILSLSNTSGTSSYSYSTAGTSGLNSFHAKRRLVHHNGKIYFINYVYPYSELWTFDPVTGFYVKVHTFFNEIIDFVFTTNYLTVLYAEYSTSSNNFIEIFNSSFAVVDSFFTGTKTTELKAYQTSNSLSIFLTTSKGIYQYYTDLTFTTSKYELILSGEPSHIVLDTTGSYSTSGLNLSWIDSDKSPRRYTNQIGKIGAGLSWVKDNDYLIYPDTKKHQGDWTIVNNVLYLKGIQVSGTSGLSLPKIGSNTNRFFDGKVDYVSFDTSVNTNTTKQPFKNLTSFTIDFTLNPRDLKPNSTVFYFGQKRPSKRTLIGNFSLYNLTQTPSSYIMFTVNNAGFPAFIVKNSTKNLILRSSKVLTVGVNNNISVTWDYTSSRVSARMYINGELVGSLIDQAQIQNKVVVKPALDIRTIPFDINNLGKSEFLAYPLYNGYMSEVRVWNKVLNQAQINVRAGAPINETDNLKPNLKSYWNLKDSEYIVADKIANRNGTFIGGLGSDAILPTIKTPTQIVETADYLYILTQDSKDNIYRINTQEEFVQQMLPDAGTSGRSIKSIQVDNNNLYYLIENKIYKYDHVNARYSNNKIVPGFFTPSLIVSQSANIYDFAVAESHPYYLIGNNILRETDVVLNSSTLPDGTIPWGTNGVGAMFISTQDKDNNDVKDFINIYVQDNSNKLHILSGDYNGAGIQVPGLVSTGLSYKGVYPLFEPQTGDLKTWLFSGNTVSLRMVNNTKKVYLNNVELDQDGEYFNFESVLQDITVTGNRIIIASKHNGLVDLWSYDISTSKYQLFKSINSDKTNVIQTDSNVCIDCFNYSGKNYIILGYGNDVALVSFGARTFNDKVLFSSITNYPITELKSVSALKWDVVSTSSTGSKYFNLINLNDISLWEKSLKYKETTKGWWAADFGVAFSHINENYSTSGNLNLLKTVVKEDFSEVKFDINKNFNENNYIVPNLSGKGWFVGKRGLIIRTTDFGNSFEALKTDTLDHLTDISFFDDVQGMAVGDNGTVLYTFNGGDIWERLTLAEVEHKQLHKVLMYQKTRAIIVGQGGLVLHITLSNKTWKVDKVLVPAEIASFENETDTQVHILYKDNIENTTIISNVVDIKYFDGVFYLASDSYVVKLTINYLDDLIGFTNVNYVLPEPVKTIDLVKDPVTNELTVFALTVIGNILQASLERITPLANTNIYPIVNTDTRTSVTVYKDYKSNGLFINNNRLYRYDKDIYSTVLYSGQDETWVQNIINFEKIDNATDNYFKPRLLFLDYYLGRKINIQLEPGQFIAPEGKFDKLLLDCYKMLPGDYIEFSDHGTVKNQRNYLAIQDYFLLNRRLQDAGLNTYGRVETPRKYNKRLTAVSNTANYSIETFILNGTPTSGSYASTASAAEFVSELAGPVEGLYENTKVNKIKLYNTPFTATGGDILELTAITNIWNVSPTLKESLGDIITANDKLVIRYTVTKQNLTSGQYVYNIVDQEEIITITEEGYLDLPGIGLLGQQSEDAFGNYTDITTQRLAERIVEDTTAIIGGQSNVNFTVNVAVHSIEWLIFQQKVILREKYINDLILWDQFSPDLLADLKYPASVINSQQLGAKLRINNLNYFSSNGQNLYNLKECFDKHLLSEAYDLVINEPNHIIIKGKVDNNTKYYNLESNVTWKNGVTNYNVPVKYPEGTVYGPTYEIMSILENLDPVLTYDYELDMPEETFGINGFPTNEFTLTGNIFYATKNFNDLDDTTSNYHKLDKFLPGTFIDIQRGNTTIKRCYVVKKTYEKNYLGNDRVLLYVDRNLDVFTSETSTQVYLRSRNKLIEISKDLEFTDDVTIVTPATDGIFGTSGIVESAFNKAVYNFTKTSKVYSYYLLNDDNIKKNISAIVHLDSRGDLVMSVVNWLDDPNFAYRPVDAFEMGRDFKPKKGITVRPYHYHLDSDWFQLKDLDFNKYTFQLTDGLSLQGLTSKYPWILNAEIDDAVIGENESGLVWYKGNWFCGRWDGGTWYSGTAYDIDWLKGEWYSRKVENIFNIYTVSEKDDINQSTWLNGFWGSGTWNSGRWFDGTFYFGTFVNGEFYGGTFLDGLWQTGKFLGGTWAGGTWLNGEFSSSNLPAIWENGTWLGGDFKNGTWRNGIWDQTSLRKSRFGTQTSPIKKAIWEFGLWKNGEFHDLLNEDESGNPLPSTRYKYSVWKNGIWKKGHWYGGTFQMGRWFDGIWYNGLLQSSLDLKSIYKIDDNNVRFDFKQPHGFKLFNDNTEKNRFTIIGDPNTNYGFVTNTAKFLGTNTDPKTHEVIEFNTDENYIIVQNRNNQGDRLLNETELLINPDFNFQGYLKANTTLYNLNQHSVQFWFSVDEEQNKTLINHPSLNIKLIGDELKYTVAGSELSFDVVPGEFNHITAQTHNGVQQLWRNNTLIGSNTGVYTNSTSGSLAIGENLEGALYELKLWNFNLDQREVEDSMSNYQVYSTSGYWNTSYSVSTSGTSGYDEYILAYYPLAGTSGVVSMYESISNSIKGNIQITASSSGTSGTSGTSGGAGCYDYTLPSVIINLLPDPTKTNKDYITGPKPVTHWINGIFHNGIWEMGYWENGIWNGGIWINGVFERGQFGE